MNTSEVLHKAADLIEERGWATGTWGKKDGPLCLEGAIAAVIGYGEDPMDRCLIGESCPAYAAVTAYLDFRPNALCTWNDREARNAAEVIEVLRGAAAVEELRESPAAARGPLNTGPAVRVPAPVAAS